MSAAEQMPEEVALEAVGLTKELARGGLGAIREVRPRPGLGDKQMVFKRFHDPRGVDWEALRAMVGWRRSLSRSDQSRVDRHLTWPLAVVVGDDGPVGFLMYRVPPDFEASIRTPSGGRRAVLREAQYLIADSPRARRLGITEPSDAQRLELLWRLADTIAFLHDRRIVVGDLSSRNVLWSEVDARIVLVDCDSMVLGGVGSPHPPAATVDWDDPALAHPAASSDIYKLGLFAVRTLARRFQTRSPDDARAALDSTARMLIERSLSSDPDLRPSARAWAAWASSRRAARSSGSAKVADAI